MEFDQTFSKMIAEGVAVDYGIVFGGARITLIKSGRGGSCRGEEDKYLRMAHRLRDRRGDTVICSSNPVNMESKDCDRAVIEEYMRKQGEECRELCLIGSSNGGYQNALLAAQLPQVCCELLCINMPLMINFHKLTAALQGLEHTRKIFVYGTKDPSFFYVPFLERRAYPLCRVIRAEGADHVFAGRTEEFVALSDLL